MLIVESYLCYYGDELVGVQPVHINYYDKSVLFHDFVEEEDLNFIFAKQVEEILKDEAQVFAMFASLKVEIQATMVDLFVVCEFLYVCFIRYY